jgi:hypothetical protein
LKFTYGSSHSIRQAIKVGRKEHLSRYPSRLGATGDTKALPEIYEAIMEGICGISVRVGHDRLEICVVLVRIANRFEDV